MLDGILNVLVKIIASLISVALNAQRYLRRPVSVSAQTTQQYSGTLKNASHKCYEKYFPWMVLAKRFNPYLGVYECSRGAHVLGWAG